MGLMDLYQTFHGKLTRRKRSVDFHVPKGLVVLGKAVAIEYRCSKWNGGGDGTEAVYRHEFETPAYVCADERMRNQIYIIGNRVKVTDAGIEN
jgi:hypothetical protein